MVQQLEGMHTMLTTITCRTALQPYSTQRLARGCSTRPASQLPSTAHL